MENENKPVLTFITGVNGAGKSTYSLGCKWNKIRELPMSGAVERALNSVGKACFIRYFRTFADDNLSNTEIAIILSNENGYTDKACRTRTSKARTIIKNGWTCTALELVLLRQSNR